MRETAPPLELVHGLVLLLGERGEAWRQLVRAGGEQRGRHGLRVRVGRAVGAAVCTRWTHHPDQLVDVHFFETALPLVVNATGGASKRTAVTTTDELLHQG